MVPDVFHLLAIHMLRDEDIEDWYKQGCGKDFLEGCFTPPAGFKHPAPPPRSAARSGSDLQVQDEHYNNLCKTIDDLYSRLPDGWEDQYRDGDGLLDFKVVRSQVEG